MLQQPVYHYPSHGSVIDQWLRHVCPWLHILCSSHIYTDGCWFLPMFCLNQQSIRLNHSCTSHPQAPSFNPNNRIHMHHNVLKYNICLEIYVKISTCLFDRLTMPMKPRCCDSYVFINRVYSDKMSAVSPGLQQHGADRQQQDPDCLRSDAPQHGISETGSQWIERGAFLPLPPVLFFLFLRGITPLFPIRASMLLCSELEPASFRDRGVGGGCSRRRRHSAFEGPLLEQPFNPSLSNCLL